jgi:membrane-bound lytic murein transglycosylase A
MSRHSRSRWTLVTAGLASGLLAGCLTAPPPAAPPPTPRVAAPEAARAIAETARYERVGYDALPAIAPVDWAAAWPAWLQSCGAIAQRAAWRAVCAQAATVDARDATAINSYFVSHFDLYRVSAANAETRAQTGLVTGYYEPLLRGSRTPSALYSVPLYRVPADLVVVDLAGVYPEVANLRLRGKLKGGRLVPYPARSEIVGGNLLSGSELLWVDDAIDAFFLQVQGSGRVRLPDGNVIRVGYADQNGHPYRSIGRWLVEQGQLTLDQASMQGIKGWAARNPERMTELLNQNPSFVFFRELPLGDARAGPLGALGVALTPGHSVAVDPKFIPLGAPVVLQTTHPVSGAPLARPMVAQDTGSAIRGPLRFDLFWGFDENAGQIAGRQRHPGQAWLLLPKGQSAEALLRR